MATSILTVLSVRGGRTLTQQHALLDAAIKKVGNRYLATMLVAKRMRQLYHGAPPYVAREDDESLFTVALREIAEGHLVLQEIARAAVDLSGSSSSATGFSIEAAHAMETPETDPS
jgi:DNA-directed RNA polymerase omega subunit